MSASYHAEALHWMQRAHSTLQEADVLAAAEQWLGCINRIYYATFYAARALVVSKGLKAKTHAGVRTLFSDEFVRTGAFPRELAKFYSDLFDERIETDYAFAYEAEISAVPDWLYQARAFVKAAAALLGQGPD